jgi:hypothetical protein
MEVPVPQNSATTDRRSFLKSGAILAAPVAAIGLPAAALANDGTRAKLARIEDERAIETLHRSVVRRLSGGNADSLGAFAAHVEGRPFGGSLRALREDHAHEPELELAADGLSATSRCRCIVELETEFTGNSTVERMARFQGQGPHRRSEQRVLATAYAKNAQGWRILSVSLA